MNNPPFQISLLRPENYSDFVDHMDRHVAESGVDGIHFMPFTPGEKDRPVGVSLEKLLLDIEEPGWHRCWVATDEQSGLIIGHVDLKGGKLKTSAHRCVLGMGIETVYRGMGLGSRLLDTAIGFARKHPQLAWIDLSTFSTNTPARSLYKKKGFSEIGVIRDRFRIEGLSIDDVQMNLRVKDG